MEIKSSQGNRFEQQLKSFLRILDSYQEDKPLHKFLPEYFRKNRQMGSTDRRIAHAFVYNFFRLGRACANLPAEERLFIAEFLVNDVKTPFLKHFKTDFDDRVELPLESKIEYLKSSETGFNLSDVFPFYVHLSPGFDQIKFFESFFIQPDLFIKVHPDKSAWLTSKLEENGIWYIEEGDRSLRLLNGSKLDLVFPDEKYFEVQDLSSQEACEFFNPQKYDYWWDCCAASGGKSINLYHQQPTINLLVSDIRESILENLTIRFANAGIAKYQTKILDLTKDPQPFIHSFEFDGILYDAPCSGSGTWGRSPEMINQFQEYRIKAFQNLQKSIASNIIKYLKPGKPLVYITCSVFKQENEDVVEFMVEELGLKLQQMQTIAGYERKSDSMFVARLLKV